MTDKRRKDEEEEEEEMEVPDGPVSNAWAIKIPSFKKGQMKMCLQEESSFMVIFPKYREKYLKESWPILAKAMEEYGVKAELDIREGTMKVLTTRKTWDPAIILKARDVIVLLGRSVPVEQALKVLRDDTTREIIKIKSMVRNKEKFIKYRQRLIGANGTVLKALELLTNCYILVQGSTVATIGPYKGVQQVVRVVSDTMRNIHPVYLLKSLMIKRKLSEDPNLKNEDWSRFLPSFKKKNVQKKKAKKKKKPYTPFPPPMSEQNLDKDMEEGKYFIDQEDRISKKKKKISEEKRKEVAAKQKLKKEKSFISPKEVIQKPVKAKQPEVDIERLKKKLK